jgi:hypothetical protein
MSDPRWHPAGPEPANPHRQRAPEATSARCIRMSSRLASVSKKQVSAGASTPTTTLRHGGPISMPYADPTDGRINHSSAPQADHRVSRGGVR